MDVYEPDEKETRMLDYMSRNTNATMKELAKSVGVDEQTAKRIHNRMFAENVCSQIFVPNYALLGYKVMIVQKLNVNSNSLPDVPYITSKILSEWKNCIDCHETFDGKIYVRSVWRNADEFRSSRTKFHKRHGMDWLAGEEVDMVPLNPERSIINVRSLWEDDGSDKTI